MGTAAYLNALGLDNTHCLTICDMGKQPKYGRKRKKERQERACGEIFVLEIHTWFPQDTVAKTFNQLES
jgi:hypothetical protein